MFPFSLLKALATSVSVEIYLAQARACAPRKGARADPVAWCTFFVITKLEPAVEPSVSEQSSCRNGGHRDRREGAKSYR